jgi:hypothetical protein
VVAVTIIEATMMRTVGGAGRRVIKIVSGIANQLVIAVEVAVEVAPLKNLVTILHLPLNILSIRMQPNRLNILPPPLACLVTPPPLALPPLLLVVDSTISPVLFANRNL